MSDKPTVYIETSVVSYLVARESKHPVTLARQRRTQTWWQDERESFQLVTSQVVIEEAGQGNPDEAEKRLSKLSQLAMVPLSEAVLPLTHEILRKTSLPADAIDDATHIAVAVTNGVEYLLTWNFKHIANAQVRAKVRAICRSQGYESPVICTPDELSGVSP